MITIKQRDSLQKITTNHGLDFMVFYGSAARGNPVTKTPDIDIAVYRRGGVETKEYLTIVSEVQATLAGREVDVKLLNETNPLFRYEVMREGVLIAGETKLYQDFYLYSYRDYQETKPLYRLMAASQKLRQNLLNHLYD